MLSAILSFLGGSAFRFIIGSLTDYLKQKQEHQQELQRMQLQADLEKARAAEQRATLELQAKLGNQQIQIQGDADVSRAEAQAFVEAMRGANQPTGNKFIDGWNGSIRPMAATISIAIWLLSIVKAAFVITEWDKNLVASILGYYFADRHIGKSR